MWKPGHILTAEGVFCVDRWRLSSSSLSRPTPRLVSGMTLCLPIAYWEAYLDRKAKREARDSESPLLADDESEVSPPRAVQSDARQGSGEGIAEEE
jgi:hypothetical protein